MGESIFDDEEKVVVQKQRKNTVDMEIDELFDYIPDTQKVDEIEHNNVDEVNEEQTEDMMVEQTKEPSPSPDIIDEPKEKEKVIVQTNEIEKEEEPKKQSSTIFDDESEDDMFSSNFVIRFCNLVCYV